MARRPWRDRRYERQIRTISQVKLAWTPCGANHEPIWRNEAVGQAALRVPGPETEIVLSNRQSYEPD